MPCTDIGVGCGTQHVRSYSNVLGSESGYLGPTPGSVLLHHPNKLQPLSGPFVSSVNCVPPGARGPYYICLFPQHLAQCVSHTKTANESYVE